MNRLACLLLSLLGILSAKGSDSAAPIQPWQSGTHTLTIDGRERTFLLDVPQHLQPGAPLILVFHGFTGSAKDMHATSGFTALAEKHGFVAAYPQGTRDAKNNTFFNVGYAFHDKETVDDASFARQLALRLVHDLKLNPTAIFSTGMSNGGDMSYYLARQPNPFVRAIAPVAGTMMSSWDLPLAPESRISVMEVHGTGDKITLWAGDPQNKDGWGAYLSTGDVMDFWIQNLALEKSKISEIKPNPTGNADPIRLHRWSTSRDNCEVVLYEIPGGGHDWPDHLGNQNHTTAEVIWDFFKSHISP
ncbi:MAG: hydrolase [Verrucomicrobiota bacterium]|jgi:polyhydroxybutyrate depolymerase